MPSPKLFAVQFDIAWEDKVANFRKIESLLKDMRPSPGSLVVLPEMFSTGFSMNQKVTRQGEAREGEAFVAHLARQYRAWVTGSVVNPGSGDKGRNEAVVFTPEGELAARYAKIHPACIGGEGQGHERGTEIASFPWGGFTVAPFICYDLRFPEIFRAAARRGANLFVVMALWPVKRQQHWITLLQARAIENQAYVVGVNRIGREPELLYAGRSIVVDPHGIIIADAGEREQVLTAAAELAVVESWRHEFPALRDAHWEETGGA
jgi:predicted amidohydrolase